MSYSYKAFINKTQRIALVSFHRAALYPPKLNRPEVDDRGYFREEIASLNPQQSDVKLTVDRGPIVGVTEGDSIFVKVKRERISDKAALFVTSSDPSAATVSTPEVMVAPGKYRSSDKLLALDEQEIQINGKTGSGGVLPKVAKVEVRYGSNQGAIIAELTVYVFTVLYANVIPHLVNLKGAKDAPVVTAIFDHNKVLELVQAIYQPCGIKFLIGAAEPEMIQSNMNENGKWKFPDSRKMFDGAAKHHTNAVNVYFVNEIVSDDGVLAWALLPGHGVTKRGVIAQTDALIDDLAINIGHELGHHFGLEHTDKRDAANRREDLWSDERLLMHPVGGFLSENCLIAMKDLLDVNNPDINHITDPEWLTVRRAVNSKEIYR